MLDDRTPRRSANSIDLKLAEDGECSIVLRGSLESPWTTDVEHVWSTVASVRSRKGLVVDITGLTGVDENGLQLLGRMRDAGVRLRISSARNAGRHRPGCRMFHEVRVCALTLGAVICCAALSASLSSREATAGRNAVSEHSQRTATNTGFERAPAAPSGTAVASREAIIDRARQSVCLIQGTFRFRNTETGELLKQSEWMLDGGNEMLEVSFSGTGFLIGADGKILTNRHIAEPWWENRDAQQIISKGYRPELKSLAAYLPGLPGRRALKLLRLSRTADLALVETEQVRNLPPPLRLERDETMAPGKEVLLLGYPAGVAPMIARSGRARLERIPGYVNFTEQQVSRALAKRNLIEPLLSGGYVSNVSPGVITLSALTSDGSSGTPVLNEQGRVDAIVFASLTDVAGGTLAVPARLAVELVGAAQ